MHVLAQSASPPPTPLPLDEAEQAVRRHMLGVWRYLRMLGAEPGHADDLTQEAFVVALGKGAEHREPPEFASFLRKTARFLWLRRQRGSGIELPTDAVDLLWERDAARDGGDELVEHVRSCVAELGERARAAIRLSYGEGLPRAAVAEAWRCARTGSRR